MSNFGERLRLERLRLDMSQEAFGEAGGVKKVAQSNYETGKRHPDSQYLERIARLGVDIQFVVTGIRMDDQSESQGAHRVEGGGQLYSPSLTPEPGYSSIPLYDVEGSAGHGRSLEGEPVESVIYFDTEALERLGLEPPNVAGIKVRGDSMVGTLADGDWVLVNLKDQEFRREGVFFLLVSGERRIKRVQRVAGGALMLISDNKHYPPELVKPEDMKDVEILGRCEIRIGKVL